MAKENINIQIFSALKVSEVSKVPVLIMSNPGLGKSTTVGMFAEIRGYKLCLLKGNSTTAEEILGYDTIDNNNPDNKATVHLRPSWFDEILRAHEEGEKTLLFLDEITTSYASVQAALLHLVFERKVDKELLPEDTLVIAAGNYAQNLSNSMELLPPLMNRFMIYNITPTVEDLDVFLCEYSGSLIGNKINYMKELKKDMKKLDKQESVFDSSQEDKIGEYIENCIKETAKFLWKNGSLDMSVINLQDIYNDVETKLSGFVTCRTLHYLKKITIATYKCFGKAGISSDVYRNMTEGLVGLGVTKDTHNPGETKKNSLTDSFVSNMLVVINDVEKLKNTNLKKYEEFFNTVAKIDDKKKIFDKSEINAIINKLKEIGRDKDLDNIERPVEPDIISNILSITEKSAQNVTKTRIEANDKILSKITIEDFMAYVCYWNSIADLTTSIQSFILNKKSGYKQDIKVKVKSSTENLKHCQFKLRSMRKLILKEDPTAGELVPEVTCIPEVSIDR